MSFPHLTFEPLASPLLRHAFTLRTSPQDHSTPPAREQLPPLGFSSERIVQAEQTHGAGVAVVSGPSSELPAEPVPEVDALITREPGVCLTIRTADCGPLLLFDPRTPAIGAAHSGRKGTEQAILHRTIEAMQEHFGTQPETLIVVLGPCVRPPHYDTDFAATIAEQAQEAGVGHFHDCGLNTGADLSRFYSYRVEKGRTGRHYAAIELLKG